MGYSLKTVYASDNTVQWNYSITIGTWQLVLDCTLGSYTVIEKFIGGLRHLRTLQQQQG